MGRKRGWDASEVLVKFEADHFSTSQQGISSCDCLTASDGQGI